MASSSMNAIASPTIQPCDTERMQRHWTVLAAVMVTMSCAVRTPMVFLTRDGCTNSNTLHARLGVALQALGRIPSYTMINVDTLPADDARRGYGTPTILVNNRDLFGLAEQVSLDRPT